MTDAGRLADTIEQLLDTANPRVGEADAEGVIALIAAAPDLLAQVLPILRAHQQLVELCEFLIDACATHRIPVPINSSLLDLAADIAGGAAAVAVSPDTERNDR